MTLPSTPTLHPSPLSIHPLLHLTFIIRYLLSSLSCPSSPRHHVDFRKVSFGRFSLVLRSGIKLGMRLWYVAERICHYHKIRGIRMQHGELHEEEFWVVCSRELYIVEC
jgi:hypothetical protein